MTLIPGASQYLNAATLANQQGTAPSISTVLDNNGADLLSVGRSINTGTGVGLSASARALNQQLLDNTATVNELFSLSAGSDATLEGAQQQILALRASLPESKLAPDLQARAAAEAATDDGGISESEIGQEVDTEV